MALAYLLDPCLQYQNRAGVNNVAGYLEVFRMDTDDRATVYVDFNGTLAPEHIGIDNDGRAVMIVESGRPYRVEMHGPNGDLFWTQQPVWTVASGGGVSGTDIVSSDGSIAVDKNTVGSFTTYDLSAHVEDSTDLLGWIRCDGASNIDGTDVWKPTYTVGTLMVGERGIMLTGGQYFHATAHVRVTKTGVAPYYDDMGIVFATYDGETRAEVSGKGIIVDGSMGLSQDFEVSCDVLPESDCELLLEIAGKELASIGVQVLDMEVHRVFSGSPYIPGGVADKPWVEENYQEKLVPGPGIAIDPETNVITATAAETEIYTVEYNGQAIAEETAFDEAYAAYLAGKTLVVKGSNFTGMLCHYSSAYGLVFSVMRPNISGSGTTAVTDGVVNYVWLYKNGTQSRWGTSGLQLLPRSYAADAGKVLMVDPEYPTSHPIWASLPDLSAYVTDTELETILDGYVTTAALQTALSTKQDVISDLSDIRAGAALGATAVQDQSYVHTDNNFTNADVTKLSGIEAGAQVNVQSDWNQTDASADDYIKNKPVIPPAVTVDQTYNASSTNAQSGTAVAGALATINEVPASTSTDEGKVLTVDAQGNPGWAAAQAPISAGNGISISSNTVSAKVDGTTVSFNASGELTATASGGGVNDVEVNGTSVVNAQGVAEVTVPTVPTLKELVAGSNITITEGANNVTISATASAQVQSNWNESDTSSPAYIQNKPSIPDATSDLTNDSGFITLSDVPAQVQANWNESDSAAAGYIQNKPTIPAAQVNADWTASSGVAEILHKPSIPSATSDLTNDSGFITLSDVPAQVQSDWNETNTSDPAYIANKPSIPAAQVNADWTASSGVAEILHKPTIPTATSDLTNDSGFITLSDVPVIGTITI